MVKLTANGQSFEGLDSQSIKYTKQIADIFDLAVVSSSYTNGFKIPKTPLNTQIMQGLGIIGDTSQIPYSKVGISLSDNGFVIFKNGWLSVSSTDDYYNVSCIDGMIDFFKAIENKTMGSDLNLSNFSHIKDLPSVIASFTNEYYKYIVADYNGKNIGINGTTEGINIDYLVPCFNMRKLFDLVMNTFGFPYNDNNIEEINDWWITYPKSPAETVNDELSAELNKSFFASQPYQLTGDNWTAQPSFKSWDTSVVNEGVLISNWTYKILDSSPYRIEVGSEMYALYRSRYNQSNERYLPITCLVLVNGNVVISFQSDPYEIVERDLVIFLNYGDILEFRYVVTPYFISLVPGVSISGILGDQGYILREIRHNSTYLKVYKTNQGNVNLSDAFKDYQIKDFIKEVFWRTAVTPTTNMLTNEMSFVSLDERLDFSRAVDWSDKYIQRKKETYIQGSYAQKNIFKHKYNAEDDISQNGYLYVNNKNLEAEKTLVQSNIYAPELINFDFGNGIKTNKFAVWQRETKEDADGVLSIEYKGLNNRFYIMKLIESPTSTYTFISEAVPAITTVSTFPYASTDGTTYDQIVPLKYNAYSGVLDNFRSHEIELALNLNDILGLYLTRPYYIKKEGMYYVLNRVFYQEGQTLTGEFIRINKVLN